jgi:F420-dependent oxidoreductase-like protein
VSASLGTMPHPLRIGLKLAGQDTTADDLRTVWRIADEAGFDHLWDFDHYASIGAGGTERPVFEGWALQAAMAVATTRVRFGCNVTGNTYRHPAQLAKLAVTVDHLSGGRLEFGIGAAWAEAEHTMFGWEGLDHRVGRLSESLRVMRSLWTEERTTFPGRYYQLTDAIANPKPIQKPYPPIWIGAGGDQMLRLVARHADVWNPAGAARQNLAEATAKLEAACARIGRDPSEIRRCGNFMWDGADRSQLVELVGGQLEVGFTELIIQLQPASAVGIASAAAEALADVRALAR